MNLVIAALVGGFMQAAGSLVGRVLLSLGIGFVAYSGIDTSITFARDFLISSVQGLPAQAVAVASILKIGVVVSILTSAILTRAIFNGLTGGVMTRMVQK